VAGFVVIWLPNGLGVRELFLTVFLVNEIESVLGHESGLALPYARHAAVLLRVTWTIAELLFIGTLYLLPSGNKTTTARQNPESEPITANHH
jgi:hypothetical protein